MRAPCWKQSTGYIPEDLQARHVKYVPKSKSKNLRLRDLKVSGKKAELVARVFAASENHVPVKKTAEEVESDSS